VVAVPRDGADLVAGFHVSQTLELKVLDKRQRSQKLDWRGHNRMVLYRKPTWELMGN
jgi:hypothetical protein